MKIKYLLVLLGSLFYSALSAEELKNLDNRQLKLMQYEANALVVDIRTPKEWLNSGVIPGSHQLEFFNSQGRSNPQKWLEDLQKIRKTPDQPIVLVCRFGNRSGKVGEFLAKQLNMKSVYHLSSGMRSWVGAGNPVETVCADASPCQ